ncbi:hypothetical protein F4679DRAFT_591532 [Xylaria curta]|nr:hypothetical protein F4679DRAFT_591532 [Xylaria curta]
MAHSKIKTLEYADETNDDFGDDDFDIAINHMRNPDLHPRDKVKKFFSDIQQLKSLEDTDTRQWLSRLPLAMYDEVVPLFDDDNSSTGYQLHPSFTSLALSDVAQNPHPEIFCLSVDGKGVSLNTTDGPHLIMGIGRLFVNAKAGDKGHLSKWTGYEVFVDYELGLWMVFDAQSKTYDHRGWYQFSCKLVKPDQHPQNVEPIFSYAKFCDSLHNLSSASFESALALVEKTKAPGTTMISQVQKEEIHDILHQNDA